jgi:CDP-diacylglycerol--glycerol-3-phosphate 3-phosphatidyltransferase
VITLSRLLLLAIVVSTCYRVSATWQLVNVFILILVFVSDGLDGYVARLRNESSQFGAMFDIAADRIVELTMWIVFVDIGLVPVWVPIVFIFRGVLVDAIRTTQATEHRQSPFSMIVSRLGRFIVASKSMRVIYAVLKAVTFCWLMLLHAIILADTAPYSQWLNVFRDGAEVLVYLCVALCLLRGAPVLIEYAMNLRAVSKNTHAGLLVGESSAPKAL